MAGKAEYTKPASQIWAEEQEKTGNASTKVLSTFEDGNPAKSDGQGRDFTVEGNKTDAYVGTDPIYQTYANETEAPMKASSGVEKKLESRVYDGNAPAPKAKAEDKSDEGDEGKGDDGDKSAPTLTTGVQTPPK